MCFELFVEHVQLTAAVSGDLRVGTMSVLILPTEIHIGTRGAFHRHNPYVYRWEPTLSILMCESTTEHGLQDECLVMVVEESVTTGKWFVAAEGSLTTWGFSGRRSAFRSKSSFWNAGFHDWYVNRVPGDGEPYWEAVPMIAETRIPQGGNFVRLCEGLPQLPLTDRLQQLAITQ